MNINGTLGSDIRNYSCLRETHKELKYVFGLVFTLSFIGIHFLLYTIGVNYLTLQETEKKARVVKYNTIVSCEPDTFWVNKSFIICKGIVREKHGNKLLVDCKEHYSHVIKDDNKSAKVANIGDPCTITEVKTVGPSKTYVKYGKFDKKHIHNRQISKWENDKYHKRKVRK